MVEVQYQHFMTLNRKLDDVHHKFILDCSKVIIGPTLTFKALKEILGGFELVGCTVRDFRNASRDVKAYAHGFDVQMVLDDMTKKKEMSGRSHITMKLTLVTSWLLCFGAIV